jgi:hypothetical protein
MINTLARTAGLVLALLASSATWSQTVQEHVHGKSHEVMPFDVAKTVHVFRMTEDGGVQRVVVRGKDRDARQIALIRQHLEHEAMQFQMGNFGDPAQLHGQSMPGLAELHAGAAAIKVAYKQLPDGGEIDFSTSDIKLVTAIHRWFGAQLSEHGADAKAE